MKNKHQAIFFDLDGTLLDTAPDLYTAMLATLSEMGRDLISFEVFRPHVHTGTTSMIKGSLHIEESDPLFPSIRQIFLDHYQSMLHRETDFFPGMASVLAYLDEQHIPWGIVTNKPSFLTNPLLASFGLDKRSQCIISGDTLPEKKPHPSPLLHACKLTAVSPEKAVYIGDTPSDVVAAKAAGMGAIAVVYGYHDPNSQPESWGADHLIEEPLKLLDIFSNK